MGASVGAFTHPPWPLSPYQWPCLLFHVILTKHAVFVIFHLDYRNYASHIPLILNYVAAALFPVSTVLFLAANEKARRLWRIPYHHFCNFMSKDPAASRNTTVTQLVNENSADRQLFSQT